jgi:predicted transcriptional regulator
MSQEELIPGLKFVSANRVTPEECKILTCILTRPCTAEQIAVESEKKATRVYSILKVLELKGLVLREGNNERKASLYRFNESSID